LVHKPTFARGTTVSGLVADLLRAQSTDENPYNLAMHEALTREPFLTSEGFYLSRQEVHDRERPSLNANIQGVRKHPFAGM
jgi:hypothetical protein